MSKKIPKYLPTDQEVLEFIIKFKIEHDGNSPTIREIMAGTNVKSTAHVTYVLDKLTSMQKIKIEEKKRISIPGFQYSRI